jgi:hypothetical protein
MESIEPKVVNLEVESERLLRALGGFDPNPPLARGHHWDKPHASIVQLDFSDSNRSRCCKSTRHAFFHEGRR